MLKMMISTPHCNVHETAEKQAEQVSFCSGFLFVLFDQMRTDQIDLDEGIRNVKQFSLS